MVWGLPSLSEIDYLVTDEIESVKSIYYGSSSVGNTGQEVLYSELTDHRGNQLPTSLQSPRVFIRHKGVPRSFVAGTESTDRFRIARDPEADGPVTVDLMVVEIGD
jgi:hypothetical protein